MKIHSITMLLMLAFLIGVGIIPARAQALIEGTIEANVPFAFMVKDTTLPAGKYTLQRLDEADPKVLEIRTANGRTAIIFEAENAQIASIPHNPELVFDKIGDQYFLSQIWANDSDIGYQLPKTKTEERLEGDGMQAQHHSILAKVLKRTKKAK